MDSVPALEKLTPNAILKKALGIETKTEGHFRLALSSVSQWNGKPDQFLQTLSGRHDMDYCHSWTKGDLSLVFKIISELGYVYHWDSLFFKQKDEQTIRYDVSSSVMNGWSVSLNSAAITPLYRVVTILQIDSLPHKRMLSGGFLTPVKGLISVGVKKRIGSWGNLYLGLSSLKLVFLLNNKVFDIPGTVSFHGIEKGHSWLCEYGVSSYVDLRKDFTHHLTWELNVQVFMDQEETVDIRLKNLLSLRAGKLLNASIKTNIQYDKADPLIFQMENVLTIGLVVNVLK